MKIRRGSNLNGICREIERRLNCTFNRIIKACPSELMHNNHPLNLTAENIINPNCDIINERTAEAIIKGEVIRNKSRDQEFN